MGIATRPGAQRSAFRLGSSARLAHVGPLQLEIRRLYSIKLKLLFNNIKHFSEVSSCGFYAPQAPGNSHCAPTGCCRYWFEKQHKRAATRGQRWSTCARTEAS